MIFAIYDDKFHLFSNCGCHSNTSSKLATFPNDNSKLLRKLIGDNNHKFVKNKKIFDLPRKSKRIHDSETKYDRIRRHKKAYDGKKKRSQEITNERRRNNRRRFEEKIKIQNKIDENGILLTDLQEELDNIYKNLNKFQSKNIDLSLNASLTWTLLATTCLYFILVRRSI